MSPSPSAATSYSAMMDSLHCTSWHVLLMRVTNDERSAAMSRQEGITCVKDRVTLRRRGGMSPYRSNSEGLIEQEETNRKKSERTEERSRALDNKEGRQKRTTKNKNQEQLKKESSKDVSCHKRSHSSVDSVRTDIHQFFATLTVFAGKLIRKSFAHNQQTAAEERGFRSRSAARTNPSQETNVTDSMQDRTETEWEE